MRKVRPGRDGQQDDDTRKVAAARVFHPTIAQSYAYRFTRRTAPS